MLKEFNLEFFKYIFEEKIYLNVVNLIYIIFKNLFFTKSSFLFGSNVGWNKNFFHIYDFTKTIVIFIWEMLTWFIYPLKLFSNLFSFLVEILTMFNQEGKKFIGYIERFLIYAVDLKIEYDDGFWEYLKSAVTCIFKLTVGGLVIYFFKDVQSFLLESFNKIGFLLFNIVLKILNIFIILLKILLVWMKVVIKVVEFILFIFFSFISEWSIEETKNNALVRINDN
ncbi:hypothetical protein [Candidatus Phytoplasma fraxini]|uniref:Uncharacterized protein n=1 Tax=Ash yellows phytoplasma TaxID=35780 RepID=A0ABZ2U9C5_ASHYP